MMTNFIGEYVCKLDAKGRVMVPSGLKKQFSSVSEGKFVLKRGIELCLELYQKHEWEEVSKQVVKLNPFVKKNRQFARRFNAGATVVEVDAVGRLLLPKSLVEYAEIGKEVVMFAYGNKIEVWAKSVYDQMMEEDGEDFAELAEDVMGEVNSEGADE